jgi:diguanylate cyclase (GGDEF)-like protein
MERRAAKLRDRGWNRIATTTLVGTAGCLAVSLLVHYALLSGSGITQRWQTMVSAITLPLIVGAPLFFLLGLKLRELSVLKQKYAQAIAHDSLTSCLNGPTFAALVDAYDQSKGALLVIDADHFKSINAQFGHSRGDEALRAIARAIRASVRNGDLVGRVGGQKFGVFLPGASRENAEEIGERIRVAVSEALFEPVGSKWPLTVSTGAVTFEDQTEFDELFRAADQTLNEAKSGGRNRTAYRKIDSRSAPSSLH